MSEDREPVDQQHHPPPATSSTTKRKASDTDLPWEFSFEVKFYPTTPTTIVDDHARYYVFIQLRRDILTGRLPATADTHALLGSFVAQIEFGDAPAQVNDEATVNLQEDEGPRHREKKSRPLRRTLT
uniref:FERM domain-containing protein n=1 Tax=Caenorhabditis japonica TaxID=281687 RepID=A0A8R1E2K0_CAEJA